MNNSSVQIRATPPLADGPSPGSERARDPLAPLKKALKPIASLRLTVVLFALSMVLVFCGTLAQMDNGLWAILSGYFRAFVAWIPFQVFIRFGQVFFWFPKTWYVPGSFPFPGGYVVGGALLLNLIAAHFVRFRLTWKRSGILMTHGGLILLMLGELVTGLFAVEGNMTIETGSACNFVEHADKVELAIIDASDPKVDRVVVVPETILRNRGPIRNEQLPFDIEVGHWMVNSSPPRGLKEGEKTPATQGFGLDGTIDEEKGSAGTDTNQKRDAAATYVTLKKKGDTEPLATYLVSVHLHEQPLKFDGKTYQLGLRFQREYKPYTLVLEEFHHDLYPGTNTPKNFSSKVRLIDPEQGENREVLIYMNNPLRYAGATFYQSSYLPNDEGTILQVVTNPGAAMPYVACFLVSMGMVIHFGIQLLNFLQRRAMA